MIFSFDEVVEVSIERPFIASDLDKHQTKRS
jgi:hypothetical protein